MTEQEFIDKWTKPYANINGAVDTQIRMANDLKKVIKKAIKRTKEVTND